MATLKLRKWDSAEHLKTEEDMVRYLEACMEEAGDDAAFIAKALGNIARAKGMTQLAKETGLGRESLYKALSGEGNPSFATILKVVRALGLKLHPEVAQAWEKAAPASM
jgi:probable addiction module antidote protein